MSDPRPPAVPHFFDLAVRHLQLIDDETPPRLVRLHSHFALTFLQLGLERQMPAMETPVLTIVEGGGR